MCIIGLMTEPAVQYFVLRDWLCQSLCLTMPNFL